MLMHGNFAAVEILNAKVKDYGENEGKIKQNEEIAIHGRTYCVLNRNIDAKGIYRFDKQVQEKKKGKIGNKFPFQGNTSLFPSQM
jgi:hypothetical protein